MSKYTIVWVLLLLASVLVWANRGEDKPRRPRKPPAQDLAVPEPLSAQQEQPRPAEAPPNAADLNLPRRLPTLQGVAAAVADVPAGAPRDREAMRLYALRAFRIEVATLLDACLTQGAAPRSPHRLVLRFERVGEASATAEHFALASVDPAGLAPDGHVAKDAPGFHCLQTLVGRRLDVGRGTSAQADAFADVLTLMLPDSIGWSGQNLAGQSL